MTYSTIQADESIVRIAKAIKQHGDFTWTEFLRAAIRHGLNDFNDHELRAIAVRLEINDINEVNDMEREELIKAILDA